MGKSLGVVVGVVVGVVEAARTAGGSTVCAVPLGSVVAAAEDNEEEEYGNACEGLVGTILKRVGEE